MSRMNREDLIAAIVFACGAGLLLAAVIVQYLRTRKVPIGYLLSMLGLFCAALTRFPTMQNDGFFWCTIGLFGVSAAVSLVELALGLRNRNKQETGGDGQTPAAAT
ncbi:hypothetical protein [Candidatus Korobacter versatilis]|nr:hypothetical protein [Candidatus Koribacter versatilis]